MDKNIKKIISEAFNELYEEFMNEAPATSPTIRKTVISDDEIEPIIQRASRTGRGFSFEQTSGAKSQENFNIIIDNLLSLYKKNPTENIKAKEAVQNAFAPNPENRKLNTMLGKGFYGNPELEDAMAEAYTTVLLRDFDKNLGVYRMDGGFGAQVIGLMRGRIHDYIYKRDGRDALGSKNGAISLDSPAGEGRTLGDTFSSEEFTAEDGTKSTGREILDRVMMWLENHIGSSEFPVNEKQYIVFKGIVDGDSPQQIFDENPGVFGKAKDVNIYFDRFVNSKPAQEISDLVSSIYNINFNLANLDKFGLKQTSAQNPEWSSFSKVDEKFTEEMKGIQNELFNSLKSLGYGPTEFNSDKKIKGIIEDLASKNMDSEASIVSSLFNDLEDAKYKAKSKGLYGSRTTPLPNSEKEEIESDEFGGIFESMTDINTSELMERVIKRLSR